MSTRLLVIDDEESICEILKYNLEKKAIMSTWHSAPKKRSKWTSTPYDLFIVDIMMERLSGFDFAKRLRNSSTTEETPIIFAQPSTAKDDTVMGLNIGADDYITKPFKISEMLAKGQRRLAPHPDSTPRARSRHLPSTATDSNPRSPIRACA